MTALYKVGDERALEFDFSGLPYSAISTDFLKGLGKALRFEGLLKCVALPRLSVENPEELDLEDPMGIDGMDVKSSHMIKSVSKTTCKGLNHMESIFGWLRKHHVDSILKVTVVDYIEPSYSEESIERCMAGFNVQLWNWYKLDLCCSVIVNSAPKVRDVTLYASGNNAVLMGWSSPLGLLRLESLWGDPHPGSFGSSVSTALAAELAGVMLYCDRLVNPSPADMMLSSMLLLPASFAEMPSPLISPHKPGNAEQNGKAVAYLRNPSKMKEAFQNLSKGSDKNKFPQVWDYLAVQAQDDRLVWNEKAEEDSTARTKLKLEDFLKKIKS
ncbi:hypothetical protein QBC36DRAFT_313403 [Triangularia setosa]|uniref:Peptidase S8/S53 domain-containing protein n=1 Tax=Triangularia setosa TaxID=2587417 RepID=A0AAN6W248_9PEZI|nr:hypothetical protein QBC36DRAFT_313403 [Podospora setosa]